MHYKHSLKNKSKSKPSGLMWQWILSYTSVLLMPILICSFYYFHSYNLVEQRTLSNQHLILENSKEQIDSACPNWQTAIQDVETLKKAEIETCYLSFLNISIKSEAMLLGINPDSANKRRLRTRQALKLTNTKIGIYEHIVKKTWENITI